VEYIWGYCKQHELPNLCPKDFAQLSRDLRAVYLRLLAQGVHIDRAILDRSLSAANLPKL